MSLSFACLFCDSDALDWVGEGRGGEFLEIFSSILDFGDFFESDFLQGLSKVGEFPGDFNFLLFFLFWFVPGLEAVFSSF